MKTNSKRKTQKKKEEKPKVSYHIRPEGMSLERWQILLRKQAAEKACFNIIPLNPRQFFGDFEVSNHHTSYTYKVAFRGKQSDWNYCSCLDFKTNALGTCKHIEAVRLFLEKKRKRFPSDWIPSYTSVYLSYKGEREVRIRIGSDNEEAFRILASRYFSSEGVLLEDSYDRFSDFLQQAIKTDANFRCYDDALEYVIHMRERHRRSRILQQKYPDGKLTGLLRTVFYPYQEEGVLFAVRAGRCIIADEMGLGKTVQAIGTAEVMRRDLGISSVLVLCPTSLKYQWKREIEKFTGQTVLVIEGNHLKRCQQYESSEFYKIVSYQSATNDVKILKTLRADLIIMDEAQRLKNWNTQIAKAVKRMQSDYMLILSGTPLENKLEELYAIVQHVDPYALGPYYKFMDNHRVQSESGKILGYKNLNEVSSLLKKILLRRRKSEVNIQLPKRIDKILYVPMTKEQKEIHDEFKSALAQLVMKWQRMHFLSENDRRRLLLLMSQMRMVSDSTYILDQKTRFDTKINELICVLTDFFETGNEKVVVFSQWERMTRLVAAELEKLGIGYEYLHGGIPSEKRKKIIDNFNDNVESRVFLSTDAGSTGLNLQTASLLVNLDLPWNPAVLEQRIARIHRMGQNNNVQVINFVSLGTIEENMLATLNFKSSMFEGVLDDGADTVFLEDSKFNKLMSTLEDVTFDSSQKETDSSMIVVEDTEEKGALGDTVRAQIPFDEEEEETSMPELLQQQMKTSNEQSFDQSTPTEIITQGIRFFSSIARTLSSPEKTKAFVDALVEEDKETGKATLKIDVPDKETVVNVLNMFGKWFENVK